MISLIPQRIQLADCEPAEYAAAFFLLADHLQDAVSVLHNQMNDVHLAIAVARVYEGDDGPVLRSFLTDKILPQAAREGNRWLATWAFWMLNKRDSAVRALVVRAIHLVTHRQTFLRTRKDKVR